MKKITLAFLLLGAFMAKAQEVQKDTIIQSLKESIDEHSMKFSGLDERLSTMDSDLAKLTKIKVSGYIQAQYDVYDTWGAAGHGISVASTTPPTLVTNSFFLRRARIKFAYEAAEGVKFVLQPDFSFDKVSLKDAYVVLNDRWTKTFSLFLGQFDRPNYELEYSSGSIETLERTRAAGILYPGEKELGAKLEANFETKYHLPLKLQLAVVNGNFNLGAIGNQLRDIDNNKDVIVRAVYSLKLPSSGLGIDFGGHGYLGSTQILSQTTPVTVFSDVNSVNFTPGVGDKLDKKWYGAEVQVYYDFLGGAALKGEYISGTISGTTNAVQNNSNFNFNRVRDFRSFYATFIKNIGVKNQFIARYDVWDPNRKISGNQVANAGDLKYSTWSISWQYFFDDNIKINFGYILPTNEKSSIAGVGTDFVNRDKKDNTFTIRLQAKF
ncbi:porin [Flavobacterium soyangense]|uniref:Porin n=1 Tax=Flavobacterium soyangense TaxID=2023265 RepID=A0A930XUH8_9FLAO|nr:porin [Flavobacterium soyangense]MBF2707027.1 hypothetical protein [Flavobacterium soyangense]